MAKSAPQRIEQTLDEFINLAPSLDRLHPAVGNRIEARVRPGDLPEHRPDGIRVAAKVDSGDQPLLEALRRVERPERGVKCRDRPAGRARTPGAPPTSICGLPLNSSCARAPLMTPPPGVCRLAMFSSIGLYPSATSLRATSMQSSFTASQTQDSTTATESTVGGFW